MVAGQKINEYFGKQNTTLNQLEWRRAGKSTIVTGSPVVNPPPPTGTGLFLGHRPGKIYLGWSTNLGDDEADLQLNTYAPGGKASYSSMLGVRRMYNKSQTLIDDSDSKNRVVWISAKGTDIGAQGGPAGWQQVASGAYDAQLVNYFTSLVNRNKLTVFSFHHEPIGDQTATSDGAVYANACRRIRSVVDAEFPNHRILFCFNYEENRLRNLNAGGAPVNWALWIPEDWQQIWDFPSFDFYQYGANTSTNLRVGVEMSHRWWRVDELFTGDFVPTGTTAMPWMNYTPGVDITYGIGETSPRPGAFYNWQNNLSTAAEQSNMTGAKWGRDQWNYIFNNVSKFWMVSTFNSIGADPVYNDERLVPLATASHPSLVTQTGDTERIIDIYREKLDSGLLVKLAANGLPA